MNIREKINGHKWELITLAAILLLGIFLRTYHFSSWLQFEIDQSYDTALVSPAVEHGIASLPLLGPTAGGGRALRLGPAFYYLEYLSGQVFGNTPTGYAMLVLLSSIFSIPLFYFFIRRFFPTFLSLSLLLLYSSSLYLVTYGRFSWSPNVLPFLILLTFYALLRSVSEKESHKNFWFLLFALSFAITTQIHFNVFFTLPAIAAVFLFFTRPRFSWKIWLSAAVILLAVYSPMIISDWKTNGENMNFFIKKISKTQTGGKRYLTALKIDVQTVSAENLLILTGQDEINGKEKDRVTINHFSSDLFNGPAFPALGAFIFVLSVYFLLLNLIRQKEKDPNKRAFILLIFLWFFFDFFYYLSLAHGDYRLYPRFFLMFAPLTFILFGLILKNFDSEKNKKRRALILLITLAFFILNIANVQRVFVAYQKGMVSPLKLETEDVFPNTNRLTLAQQLLITNYIQSVYVKNHFPVYLQSLHEYEPVFWYHLEKVGIRYYAPLPATHTYREGNYFNIYPSSEEKGTGHAYDAADRKIFGSITVDRWTPKTKYITQERQSDSTREKTDQMKNIDALETWATALSGK